MKKYEEEFKEKIIAFHLKEGRSRKLLEKEYNIENGTIRKWIKECLTNPEKQNEKNYFSENLKLKKMKSLKKKLNS